MSINFISGKPGGGKTMYAVKLIIDELINTDRVIVTNVPLLLPRLNEYLQCKYLVQFGKHFFRSDGLLPRKAVHITERVILIDEDELPKFFTFRAAGVRLDSVTNAEWKAGKRPDYSKVKDSGVLYVLDEIHIAFNSRAWADTGAEVLYYLSQHRKLGDDVICVTQSVGNVDKQFRSVAQDYTYIRNLSKQRAGWFKLPKMFIGNTFLQPPTETSKPMQTLTFTLDATGLASCYDTAKGVGIHGRAGADTKARQKGLHWLWFALGLPLVLYVIFHFLPLLVSHAFSPAPPSRPAPGHVQASVSIPPGGVVSPISTTAVGLADYPSVLSASNEVFCTGWTVLPGNDVTVYLSDGRVATSKDDEIQVIKKHEVKVFGETFRVRSKLPPASSGVFAGDNRPAYQPSYQAPYNAPAVVSGEFEESRSSIQILPAIHAIEPGGIQRIGGVQNMAANRRMTAPGQYSGGMNNSVSY